jgi:hypothetical protein
MKSKFTKNVDFILDGFGFENMQDLNNSCWHINNPKVLIMSINVSAISAFISLWISNLTGYEPLTFIAFTALIVLETISGVQVAFKAGQKFKSRTFGRMFLKLGYYMAIVIILNLFNKQTQFPMMGSFEVDPFLWLYHGFSVAIVIQLLISVLENLGKLGFKESKNVIGVLIRKYNKWFDLEDDQKEESKPKVYEFTDQDFKDLDSTE